MEKYQLLFKKVIKTFFCFYSASYEILLTQPFLTWIYLDNSLLGSSSKTNQTTQPEPGLCLTFFILQGYSGSKNIITHF